MTPRRVTTSPTGWAGHRAFPDAVRRRILRRDPTCRGCRVRPSVQADHIVPVTEARRRGWTQERIDHPDNGQGLCHDCHAAKTRREQAAGRARRAGRKRPPMRHPGLLDD